MKKNRLKISILYALILITTFSLVLVSCDESEIIEMYANVDDDTPLRDRLFMGGDAVIEGGGDELSWYRAIFGDRADGISGYYIDIIGDERFEEWLRQFTNHDADGWRNERTDLITFIEDFNISKEKLVRAQEIAFGMSANEIEYLINWGRYDSSNTALEKTDIMFGDDPHFWAARHSLSDIEALVSGDVYKLWEAFPGRGIFHNGRAYSPEWIMNNISRAVNEEQIPLQEIERIIATASRFSSLNEVTAMAQTEFSAAKAARQAAIAE